MCRRLSRCLSSRYECERVLVRTRQEAVAARYVTDLDHAGAKTIWCRVEHTPLDIDAEYVRFETTPAGVDVGRVRRRRFENDGASVLTTIGLGASTFGRWLTSRCATADETIPLLDRAAVGLRIGEELYYSNCLTVYPDSDTRAIAREPDHHSSLCEGWFQRDDRRIDSGGGIRREPPRTRHEGMGAYLRVGGNRLPRASTIFGRVMLNWFAEEVVR